MSLADLGDFLIKENRTNPENITPGDLVWIVDAWNTHGVCIVCLVLEKNQEKSRLELVCWSLDSNRKIYFWDSPDTKIHMIQKCNPP